MTDQRISTEEAERIAFAIQGRAMEITGTGELVYDEELRDAADALRSLAAERDAVWAENEKLRGQIEWAWTIICCSGGFPGTHTPEGWVEAARKFENEAMLNRAALGEEGG